MKNFVFDENQRDRQWLAELVQDYQTELKNYVEDLDDEEVQDLTQFLRFIGRSHSGTFYPIDLDRIKIFFSPMSKISNSDIQKILAYLTFTGYGWQDNRYCLSNSCLEGHSTDHCKRMSPTSDPQNALEQLKYLNDIFLDEEYGPITLFIFCYCIAALFSKRLNSESFPIPFYLQIACDRRSVLFQLVEEIAEICDVNSGLINRCGTVGKRQCKYKSQIYYPTQSTKNDLEALICENGDVPVIIDGYENTSYYNNLLRSAANIPNSRTAIGLRDRFNVLPLFVCPTIKSSFGNVFDMDLSELDISTEYLESLRKGKQFLASHVLEFIKDADRYLFPDKEEWYRAKKQPFKDYIKEYVNVARKNYPDLTLANAKNIGFLSFFFEGFLNVFQRSFQFSDPISHDKNKRPISKEKYIEWFVKLTEERLAKLHLRYLPAPGGEGIKNKEATQLAKQIMKHYHALHLSIRVTPIAAKDGRYVFRVETLQETKDIDVINKGETVQHRLKKFEYFRFDKTDGREIKLIVSETQLQDSNLQKILQSKDFADPKKKLPYAIGIDEVGEFYVEDIAEFPHLLLGGSTNSGKSTAIRSLLLSIAYKHQSSDAQVIIMDLLSSTGESTFSIFNDHPIMVCPVIQDTVKAAKTILALYHIMKNRPQDRPASEVPYIVCIIDEFPTLYNTLNKEDVEHVKIAMSELLSKGRHSNIHLVLSAQDPSKDSVGNVANAKARIAFGCSHYRYSMNIIGNGDAAKLQGKGQMILNSEFARGKRLLGAFIDKSGMKKLLDETKASFVPKNPNRLILPDTETIDILLDDSSLKTDMSTYISPKESRFKTFEELLPDAIMWTLPQRKVANSRLLQHLHVRNAMGKQILEWMSKHNLISLLNGNHGWEVKAESYGDLDEEVIKVLFNAGYTEDKIMSAISERMMASEPKKETEPARTVDQDETKEFLENHDHEENENKEEWAKLLETLNIQDDMEPRSEQDIKLNDGEADIKNCAVDSEQVSKSITQLVKEHSDRYKFKTRPAR